MKKIVKEYLHFTRKEAVGLVILLLIMLALLYLPKWYSTKKTIVIHAKPLDSLPIVPTPVVANYSVSKRFAFDPNVIGLNEWVQLGVPAKTAQTILNYKNKGGRFRTPTDIYKIWGMNRNLGDSLLPYIHIKSESPEVRKSDGPWSTLHRLRSSSSRLSSPVSRLEINTATTAEWESLPGIGKVLAARIIRFRDKLGGFKAIEDIAKTYGISDSVFQVLKPHLYFEKAPTQTELIPIKVNINKASEKDMIAAGIEPHLASAICVSRKQAGVFKSVEELKRIIFIKDMIYNQLVAKCTVD
jgi:competence protein ComEA